MSRSNTFDKRTGALETALDDIRKRGTLGNHDRFAEVSPFFNPHPEREALYYRRGYEGFTALFLDTSEEVLSAAQMEWLKEELDAAQPVLLFMHHPVLAVDSAAERLYPLGNREEVRRLLLESGKEIHLFCGHYHTEDERREGTVRYGRSSRAPWLLGS